MSEAALIVTFSATVLLFGTWALHCAEQGQAIQLSQVMLVPRDTHCKPVLFPRGLRGALYKPMYPRAGTVRFWALPFAPLVGI